MKTKYKGLAEYLVEKDVYLALNIVQAEYLVKLVKDFAKKNSNKLKTNKIIKK